MEKITEKELKELKDKIESLAILYKKNDGSFANTIVEQLASLSDEELLNDMSTYRILVDSEMAAAKLEEVESKKKEGKKKVKKDDNSDNIAIDFDIDQNIPTPVSNFFESSSNTVDGLIVELDLSMLHDLESFEHPFQKSLERESIAELTEQIKKVGLLSPIIVRESNKGFEILSGHRRKRACISAGLDKVNCIIKNVSDDVAVEIVCDNLTQREEILPSERAKAYNLMSTAMQKRRELEAISGEKTRDIIALEDGVSAATVHRYLRLNALIPELLEMVDEKELPIKVAGHISFLSENKQVAVYEYLTVGSGKSITEEDAKNIKETFLDTVDLSKEDISSLLVKENIKVEVPSWKKAFKLVEKTIKRFPPESLEKLAVIPAEKLEKIISDVLYAELGEKKKKVRKNEME